ncbi:MAG: hypothetical protein ACFB21_00890 [Opitutales bacterium]
MPFYFPKAFVVCLGTLALNAGALPPPLEPVSEQLPPSYFPGLQTTSAWELYLAGLRDLYPDRVLAEPPAGAGPEQQREPYHEALGGNVTYYRLYSFADISGETLAALSGERWLVIDCRFLNGHQSEAWPRFWRTFGELPLKRFEPGSGLSEVAVPHASHQRQAGLPPPIVLVNASTRGPFEAALAHLQKTRAIVLLGGATAGETGIAYERLAADLDAVVVSADLRPASGEMLLGTGVDPKVKVEVAAELDYQAFAFVEKGVQARQLISTSLPQLVDVLDESEDARTAAPQERYTDEVLQRAVEILIARQLLNGTDLAN